MIPGLDLAARYVTGSGAVGGDWYDVFVLPDGRLGVVVGDVAGSGLEAAVIMGRMRSALRGGGPADGQANPPIGAADHPQRRTATVLVPPGALLCCFTDGLVERRVRPIDHGIGTLAAVLDEQIAAGPGLGATAGPAAERACAAVMRALVGNAPVQDDIAVLMLSRRKAGTGRHQGTPER